MRWKPPANDWERARKVDAQLVAWVLASEGQDKDSRVRAGVHAHLALFWAGKIKRHFVQPSYYRRAA